MVGDSFSHGRSALGQSDSAGIWLPGGVWVGWGVSEVQAIFVTSLAVRATHQEAPKYKAQILHWLGMQVALFPQK